MELSKTDTLSIKGIAIALMLWHHLFLNTMDYGSISHSLAIVFKVCVALFLFVSGYGLTKQYSGLEKPFLKNTVKFLLRRYVNFFLPYWFCFSIVVLIGNIAGYTFSEAYPPTRNLLKCFFLDFWGILGWGSYLSSWWFNKMIIQLYLVFPILYLLVRNKYTAIISAIVIVCLQLNAPLIPGNVFFIVEGGIPAFFFGMVLAKHEFIPVARGKGIVGVVVAALSCVGLSVLHLFGGISAYQAIVVRALLALSVVCVYFYMSKNWRFLEFVGKYATIIYLIHVLFQKLVPNVIYGAKYPMLIFLVFFAFSFFAAMLIDYLQKIIRYDRLQAAIVKLIEKW